MTAKKFSLSEVREMLRREEDARRDKERIRQIKILHVMEGGENENQGKLWGETGFDDIAARKNGGKGVKWTTDVEAEICSDMNWVDPEHLSSPFRQVEIFQAMSIVWKVIGGRWGEKGIQLFLWWLDAPIAVVCEENLLSPSETFTTIKEMVAECRRAAGTDSDYFPFPEEEAGMRISKERIRQKVSYTRMMAGESKPADEANRIYLTEEEKKMPLDKLKDCLNARHSISVHRGTYARAKKTGWFMRPGWKDNRPPSVIGEIYLSEDDKKLSVREMMGKYSISWSTAAKALQRGWFAITNNNRDKVKKI